MSHSFESSPIAAAGIARPRYGSPRIAEAATTPLVLGASLPLAWLTSAFVRRFLLAVILIDIPLQAGIHFFYDESLASLGALGGLDVSATTIALVLLYAGWALERLVRATPALPQSPRISRPLLGYVLLVGASTLVAKDFRLSAYEFLLILQTFLVYLYIVHWVRTRRDVMFVLVLLLGGLAIEGVLCILMRNSDEQVRFAGIKTQVSTPDPTESGNRVGGTVGSPNGAAGYLVGTMVPAFAMLWTPVRKKYRWLALIAFCAAAAALALTVSRGGWAGCAVAIVCFLAAIFKRAGPPPLLISIVLMIALSVVWLAFGNRLEQRFRSGEAGSARARVPLMKLALTMAADNPVLGVGANNFPLRIPDYAGWGMRGEWLYTVHNRYLVVWSETGTAALICYVWFLVAAVLQGRRIWRARDRFLSPLALGISCALLGLMTHMLVEVFRGRAILQLIFVSAALLTSMEFIVLTQPEIRDSRPQAVTPS